jgi:hypothetical protein
MLVVQNDIWSILEYLEMGWVKQVDLYDNSRSAIVQASSPELGNRPQSIRGNTSWCFTTNSKIKKNIILILMHTLLNAKVF